MKVPVTDKTKAKKGPKGIVFRGTITYKIECTHSGDALDVLNEERGENNLPLIELDEKQIMQDLIDRAENREISLIDMLIQDEWVWCERDELDSYDIELIIE